MLREGFHIICLLRVESVFISESEIPDTYLVFKYGLNRTHHSLGREGGIGIVSGGEGLRGGPVLRGAGGPRAG